MPLTALVNVIGCAGNERDKDRARNEARPSLADVAEALQSATTKTLNEEITRTEKKTRSRRHKMRAFIQNMPYPKMPSPQTDCPKQCVLVERIVEKRERQQENGPFLELFGQLTSSENGEDGGDGRKANKGKIGANGGGEIGKVECLRIASAHPKDSQCLAKGRGKGPSYRTTTKNLAKQTGNNEAHRGP